MGDYKVRAALERDMQTADQFRSRYALRVDGETSVEDIVKSSFWVHNASRLKVFDVIEVLPRNESYRAELLVSKVLTTNTGVKIPTLLVLSHVELKEPEKLPEPDTSDFATATYKVEWKGPAAKHCIIRNEDRALIEKNISSKADAVARIRELEAA